MIDHCSYTKILRLKKIQARTGVFEKTLMKTNRLWKEKIIRLFL